MPLSVSSNLEITTAYGHKGLLIAVVNREVILGLLLKQKVYMKLDKGLLCNTFAKKGEIS